jgi:hypothetical protein
MKAAKAPKGFHTDLEIWLTLANGVSVNYRWTCPQAIHYASNKALSWARQTMSAAKVSGRSKIVGTSITARYKPGEFKRTGDE